jgi:ElaB/YqjD/DUF883 family membrane-anchored ribosome-binding protein
MKTLRSELDALRAELAQLRQTVTAPEQPATEAPPAPEDGFGKEIAELNTLVRHMLENAEDTIAEHPVATVAGALALGIVIGRLTAR